MLESKRIFDIVFISIGIIIFWPFLLLLIISIGVLIGKPILFRQIRPGLHGIPFCIYKFRTMVDMRDVHGNLLPDETRLTQFGRFLRSTSIDELPELWNVIKGDMSLVGPRPLLMEYLPLYSVKQLRRHEIKPGITGWAQINGRNAINWRERFELDIWYIDNRSLWLDIKILFLTLLKVFRREGITQEGKATMSKFMGNQS